MKSSELDIVRTVVRGSSYQKMYPQIKNFNVFSISRLSWDWNKQVEWKLGKGKDEYNPHMMVGRVVGQAVQNAFIKTDPGWNADQTVEIHLPFEWKRNNFNGIILLGHIDLVHHEKRNIIELKSSVYSSKISERALMQASAYWAGTLHATGKDYKTKVIKVFIPPKEKILKYNEKIQFANMLFERAFS